MFVGIICAAAAGNVGSAAPETLSQLVNEFLVDSPQFHIFLSDFWDFRPGVFDLDDFHMFIIEEFVVD